MVFLRTHNRDFYGTGCSLVACLRRRWFVVPRMPYSPGRNQIRTNTEMKSPLLKITSEFCLISMTRRKHVSSVSSRLKCTVAIEFSLYTISIVRSNLPLGRECCGQKQIWNFIYYWSVALKHYNIRVAAMRDLTFA